MATLINRPARALAQVWPRRWNDDFDNFFENFFQPARTALEPAAEALTPRLDVTEKEDAYVVAAELPGVKKEDIQVTVEDGVLTIGAETKSEHEEKEGNRVIRSERHYGRYERSLRLGHDITAKDVKAAYKDGILTLTLPKAEQAKPKRIAVDVV
jgi:HSP20 family protein